MRLQWSGVVSILVVAGTLAVACGKDTEADKASQKVASQPAVAQGVQVGQAAPAFSLNSLDGRQINLADLRGKTVLIDFWATWCPPCRRALPHIQKVHEDYRNRGLVVLGINSEPPETPIAFMKQNGYTFTTLSDPGSRTAMAYGVQGIPTTFIVDPRGILSSVSVGYKPEAELRRALTKAGLSM